MPEPTSEETPQSTAVGHRSESAARSWLAPAALVIALIATGVAVWALLKPPPEQAGPSPASQAGQTGDPKARACAAYATVTAAVKVQTHTNPGAEPAMVQAVAANSRLAMSGGAGYLLAQTGPDAPADLADAIRRFAGDLQAISMNALAGVTNDDPAQAERLRDAEELNGRIGELCK